MGWSPALPNIVASLSGSLPDSIDSDKAELVIVALMAICVIGVVVVIRTIQKATTRLVLIGLLFVIGAGLWVQHQNLQDCAGECSCHVFGREVRVTDPNNVCR